jgi:hypothetical protein
MYILSTKLNQEDVNHLNRSIMSNEIETVIDSQERKTRTTWTHCQILPSI